MPDHAARRVGGQLLFDLTFVVAFGMAADELAHFLVEDDLRAALLGFAFATFAISWAWVNYSWFASAFDTERLRHGGPR